MGIFVQRIEKLFLTISAIRPDEPILPNLSRMTVVANKIADQCKMALARKMNPQPPHQQQHQQQQSRF